MAGRPIFRRHLHPTPPSAAVASGTGRPTAPAVHRNSLNLPGYKDLDLTLAKAFGLPKAPVLGESAKIELRVDATTYQQFET